MRALLVVYDNGSFVHNFPQGIAYIAASMEKNGIDVEIYHQNVNHYPDEHLTKYLDTNKFDVVGCGVIGGYYQFKKLICISKAINKSKQRPFYIIGGHGPSPDPEYFLNKTGADAAVIGEGERTIIDLLDAISSHRKLDTVDGIAFKDGDSVVVTNERKQVEDIDTIPFPAYHLFPMEYYRLLRVPNCTSNDFVMSMLSGRGCKFKCNFCYRMDKSFRPRSNISIIEEIKLLKKDYGINYIVFSDELLMSSPERTIDLCEDLIKEELGIKWWCNGRLNYAKKDVLQTMKKAGCTFINYGIEAMDDQALRNMNKALTTKIIIEGVKTTLDCDISPGLNIIFGNIGESAETLQKGVDFLLEYGDGSQLRTIRPVTPYPGSPLYYHAIEKGLLKDCADFYENKHMNSDLLTVNFTNLTDDEFHNALYEANSTLIKNYYASKLEETINEAKKLYHRKNTTFRGFRQY